jgi:hypothetical protein
VNDRGAGRWGAILGALLAVAGSWSACRRVSERMLEPAPTSSAAVHPAPPVLRVKSPPHDFGAVVQGELFQRSFELENAGSSRIELQDRTESLGCSGVIDPPTLEPGAASRVDVSCRIELYGPVRVTLPLRAKTDEAIVGEVELRGSVTPRLAFDPPTLVLRMPFGEERIVEVQLSGALADQATFSIRDSGDAGFAEISAPKGAGSARVVRLRVKGRKVGVHVGSIVASTNLARPPEVSLPYSTEVVGDLEVTPSTPYFDLHAPSGAIREVSVRSSQPDFKLRAVRVEGPFTVSVGSREANGEYRVAVTVLRDSLASDARGTLGRLVLESNDRAEPNKEVPLFAFGALNHDAADSGH